MPAAVVRSTPALVVSPRSGYGSLHASGCSSLNTGACVSLYANAVSAMGVVLLFLRATQERYVNKCTSQQSFDTCSQSHVWAHYWFRR